MPVTNRQACMGTSGLLRRTLAPVWVFYSGSKKNIIGVSPQPLMFINNVVFEKKDIALENIVKPSIELYKNLFPTKEEIINKN
jgi:hypothetical protein